jgi:hypothetical protein
MSAFSRLIQPLEIVCIVNIPILIFVLDCTFFLLGGDICAKYGQTFAASLVLAVKLYLKLGTWPNINKNTQTEYK